MESEKKSEVDLKNQSSGMSRWGQKLKDRRFIIRLVVVIIVLLALPKIWPHVYALLPINDRVEETKVQADAYIVQPRDMENRLFATGNILANQEINLSAEASGVITKLNISEGVRTRKGDLLVKINDNDLVPQLAQAKYAVEVMESNAERQKTLFERGGSSQEEYDAIQIEMNRLRSEVALLEAQISRTEIRAPFNGILGLSYVNIGAYITPTTQIATLQDISSVKIDFAVPERYSNQIKIGTPIRFTVQGSDSVFTAQVYAQEPQIDTRSRTVSVRAQAPNDSLLLRPGSFATIDVVLASTTEALILPSIALVPDMGSYKVIKYTNGISKSVPVEIGSRTQDGVEVTTGIGIGDTVLVSGLLQVRENMPVSLSSIRRE